MCNYCELHQYGKDNYCELHQDEYKQLIINTISISYSIPKILPYTKSITIFYLKTVILFLKKV